MLREEVKYLLKTTGVLNSLLHSIMHLSLKRESIVFSIEMNNNRRNNTTRRFHINIIIQKKASLKNMDIYLSYILHICKWINNYIF